MCQVNTFMFKEGELDGEKIMAITRIFGEAGFTNFYEYNNPNLIIKYARGLTKN